MEMKAMLTFKRETLEELIDAKATRSGFVVDGEIEWDDGVAIAMVRPMSPDEKRDHGLNDRPVEEVVFEQLRGIMDQVVDLMRDEHDRTREAADTSVMEWLEPFRTAVNRIESVVSSPARMSEIAQRAWGIEPGSVPTGPTTVPSGLTDELREAKAAADEKEEEDGELDETERRRRARFKRLRREMDDEEEDTGDDRQRLKGESDKFPEDMRIT